MVEAFPERNEMIIRLNNDYPSFDYEKTLKRIVKELEPLQKGKTISKYISVDVNGYIAEQILQNYPVVNPKIQIDNGSIMILKILLLFLE